MHKLNNIWLILTRERLSPPRGGDYFQKIIKNRQKLFWQFWLHQVIDNILMLNLVPHLWYLDHYWLCTSHSKQIQKLCKQLMQTDSFFGMVLTPSFMSLRLPNLTKFTTMQVYNVYKWFRLKNDVECFNKYFLKIFENSASSPRQGVDDFPHRN